MPRITFEKFYARYREVREAWESPASLFSNLDPHEQWYLHDYYRPSEKLTKKELHTHWQELHAKPTPLHQQAGRAYARLRPYFGEPYYIVPPERWAKNARNARVVVRGRVHPKLDVGLMLQAVMMLGRQLSDEGDKR